MARPSPMTGTIAVCFLTLLGAAAIQGASRFAVLSAVNAATELNVECALGTTGGLNLGPNAQIFVNCSDLTVGDAFVNCTTGLATMPASLTSTFPGALVTVDLASVDTSPGFAALEIGRLIATNATSRVGVSFSGLGNASGDTIGMVADTIATARSYLTADTPAPTVIVWIEDDTNPCLEGGPLAAADGAADLATTVTNTVAAVGPLGDSNGVAAQIGFSRIPASAFETDVCGFEAESVAFGQGQPVVETGLSGICSSITNASAIYGANDLLSSDGQATAPDALQPGTGRTMQGLGVSVEIGSGTLGAVGVTALVGCVSAPGFLPEASGSGTLLFRGVACGAVWGADYAAQCRAVVSEAVGEAGSIPVIVTLKFDISASAAVGLVDQAALGGRVIANLSIGGVNVRPVNAGDSSAANLAQLERVYAYLAYLHRPGVVSATVNVLTSVGPSACGAGGAFAATVINGAMRTVASQCAEQTEFACQYSAYPDAFAPGGATCGFDASGAGSALYGYSSPSAQVFNSFACIGAGAESSALLGYTSSGSVPSAGVFSVGPTMVSAPVADIGADLVGCMGTAGAGYLTIACGSATDAGAMSACTSAIGVAVSASGSVAVLVQVSVPSDAVTEAVTRAVRTLVGTAGVVGVQYTFAFADDATNAMANIARIVGVLNASAARVNGSESSSLTQVVVLADAAPCSEAAPPGAGYLFTANSSDSLYMGLAEIERSSVFLAVSGAVSVPAPGARCGFAEARVNFVLPVLPEYTPACNTALAASGVRLVSVDPQAFAPGAVAPGDDPSIDGAGSAVHAGVWSVGALMLVLLSLVA